MVSLQRMLLFLIGCIGMRSLLVYLAYTASPTLLRYYGYAALLPAIGFTMIYVFGLRKTGPEVGGDKIWWNQLRPVHAAFYGAFAAAALTGKTWAWAFLLVDVIFGLGAWLFHYFG